MSLADGCLNLAKWDPAIAVPSSSELTKLSRSTISGFQFSCVHSQSPSVYDVILDCRKEGTIFSENIRNATILLHRWISLYVCYVLDATGNYPFMSSHPNQLLYSIHRTRSRG